MESPRDDLYEKISKYIGLLNTFMDNLNESHYINPTMSDIDVDGLILVLDTTNTWKHIDGITELIRKVCAFHMKKKLYDHVKNGGEVTKEYIMKL